ncbi:diiron oxygenase [Streptosporangiaceae bacterium NEAU-GS5]|nr:diiron oxygenase [Streptosporangiaceae bacterium NEAU-GS5]
MSGAFGRWYEQAGVRSGPRRIFVDDRAEGTVFFPRRLVPHLAHEAVRDLGDDVHEALTLRHLYQFLHSTTHVETRVVNQGAERIANGRSGVEVSVAERLDAFKVYADEGYHALYSLDLAAQVAAATGVAVPDWDYGTFVDRLARTAADALPDAPVLAQLLQVVVFETLVTAVLNELPADPSVVGTVRDLIRDHARDEGRHHRFFAAFFHRLWQGLGAGERRAVAGCLPGLILDCLRADVAPVRASLALAGLGRDAIEAVVADCYSAAGDPARIRQITRATVGMCRSAGVFAVPGAADGFAARGLDPEAAE